MSGLLGQVLDNISQIETTIRGIQVPPSPTQQIQQEMLNGLDSLHDKALSLQKLVTDFVAVANPQLTDLQVQLSGDGTPVTQVVAQLQQLQGDARSVSTQTEALFADVKSILDAQTSYLQQLNNLKQQTQSSYDSQKSRVDDLNDQLDDLETAKKIGGFLTFGLSDDVLKITGLQQELDEAEKEMQAVQMSLTYQSMIISGTTTLATLIGKVVDILSGLRNTVSLVTADLGHVADDPSTLESRVVLRLIVAHLIAEMKPLLADGS